MIDFLKYRLACAVFSILIFATFIGTCLYKYQTTGKSFNYSVDFTGGTQVLFGFSKPVSTSEISNILTNNGWSGTIIREFSQTELLVKVKEVTEVKKIKLKNITKYYFSTYINKINNNCHSIHLEYFNELESNYAKPHEHVLILLFVFFFYFLFFYF